MHHRGQESYVHPCNHSVTLQAAGALPGTEKGNMTEKQKGMVRKCPICGCRLEGIKTDWILKDYRIGDHQVATIGTAHNARADIQQAAQFQIASNLAAYDLDYDAELNLGFQGTAWVQCPMAREEITRITFPR